MNYVSTAMYSALIDIETNAVLTVSTNSHAILFLKEAVHNSYAAIGVQFPNYTTHFPILLDKPSAFVEWSWSRHARRLVATDPVRINDVLRERSNVAHVKLQAVLYIIIKLSLARMSAAGGVAHQDAIYLSKKGQAQHFKDAGYVESLLAELPFVEHYAEVSRLTSRQATDEILFKAKLEDERLAKTEYMRLLYFAKLKRAETCEDVARVSEEFLRDTEKNAQLS